MLHSATVGPWQGVTCAKIARKCPKIKAYSENYVRVRRLPLADCLAQLSGIFLLSVTVMIVSNAE